MQEHQFLGDLPHCLAGMEKEGLTFERVQMVHNQDAPLASPCPARCFKKPTKQHSIGLCDTSLKLLFLIFGQNFM